MPDDLCYSFVRGREFVMVVMAVKHFADDIHLALAEGRFEEIAALCEEYEIQAAMEGELFPASWPFSIHLLSLLFANNLNDARFLWKRIPDSVKSRDAELAAAWQVGQAMWRRESGKVHEALRSFSWSTTVQPLVQALSEKYREKTFQLLSKAYSTISSEDAAYFLGITREEVNLLSQKGWKYEPSSETFTVQPCPPALDSEGDLDKLQSLTNYVFHLEHS